LGFFSCLPGRLIPRYERVLGKMGWGHAVSRACVAGGTVALGGCGLLVAAGDEIGFVGSGGGGGFIDGGERLHDASVDHEPRDGGSADVAAAEGGSDTSLAEAGSPEAGSHEGGSPDTGQPDSASLDSGYALGDASDAAPDVVERTTRVFVDASVDIERVGTPVRCPGVSVFSISPSLLGPGQQAQLNVAIDGPAGVVEWSVSPISAGLVSSPTALTPTFECSGAGTATITVTVGLAGNAACVGVPFTTLSGTVDCRAK
jgi:hypothetical protein